MINREALNPDYDFSNFDFARDYDETMFFLMTADPSDMSLVRAQGRLGRAYQEHVRNPLRNEILKVAESLKFLGDLDPSGLLDLKYAHSLARRLKKVANQLKGIE